MEKRSSRCGDLGASPDPGTFAAGRLSSPAGLNGRSEKHKQDFSRRTLSLGADSQRSRSRHERPRCSVLRTLHPRTAMAARRSHRGPGLRSSASGLSPAARRIPQNRDTPSTAGCDIHPFDRSDSRSHREGYSLPPSYIHTRLDLRSPTHTAGGKTRRLRKP